MQMCTTNGKRGTGCLVSKSIQAARRGNNQNNSRPQPPAHQDQSLSTIIWESRKSPAELKRVSIEASGGAPQVA